MYSKIGSCNSNGRFNCVKFSPVYACGSISLWYNSKQRSWFLSTYTIVTYNMLLVGKQIILVKFWFFKCWSGFLVELLNGLDYFCVAWLWIICDVSKVNDYERGPVLSFQHFPQLLEILVSQESSYCFIILVKFHGWKVLRLEDVHEKVSGYGNHNH